MGRQKRVLAVHDISGFGRCSLTVALPVISAAGIETSVLPTAVLSTHTGGFTGYTYRDLTDDIIPIVEHWESLGLEFDGIYTGFLGSKEQTELICQLFDKLAKPGTVIAVDPVMADFGKLYGLFDESFPAAMKSLCMRADIIMPNITEACLLCRQEYRDGPYTEPYVEELLRKLSEFGPKHVVLTGVFFDDRELGAASYDTRAGKIEYAFGKRIEGSYHGTGDVFGSALVAAVISGKSVAQALQIAVDFTVDSIRRSREEDTETRFGVNFEAGLGRLAAKLS